MDKIRESFKLQLLAAIALLAISVGVVVLIFNDKPTEKLDNVILDGSLSEIVSTDARQTAAKLIIANGTMGSLEEITPDSLNDGSATDANVNRRFTAINLVENGVVPGSPLVSGSEKKFIETYTRGLDEPAIYEIENVKAGKPMNERMITVTSKDLVADYHAVDVEISFESIKTVFTRSRDGSYDGTNYQIENRENYVVKVTVIQSGDLWFGYDIENSEYGLNERMSTWKGIAKSTINYENNKEVGYIIVPGITPVDETGDSNE